MIKRAAMASLFLLAPATAMAVEDCPARAIAESLERLEVAPTQFETREEHAKRATAIIKNSKDKIQFVLTCELARAVPNPTSEKEIRYDPKQLVVARRDAGEILWEQPTVACKLEVWGRVYQNGKC